MKKKAKKEQDVLEYMRSISNIPKYEPMKTSLLVIIESTDSLTINPIPLKAHQK